MHSFHRRWVLKISDLKEAGIIYYFPLHMCQIWYHKTTKINIVVLILRTREFLVCFLKNKDGDFTKKSHVDRWQKYQSHKMFTRILKLHGIQKSRLKRWQSQIIWKCEKRSSRNVWRSTRGVWSCFSEWKYIQRFRRCSWD